MAKVQSNGLVKQAVSVSLTGGIDRKTDPKQLQNGQMYTADNVQYITEGQIRKRFGYTNLTPTGGLQGAPFSAVGCRDGVEPVILGSGSLNRYNPQTGLSTYILAATQGHVTSNAVTASSGAGTKPSPPIDASIVTDGQKYLLITWQEANGSTYSANGYANVYYGIQDIVTGVWIISPTLLSVDVSPNGNTLVDTTAPKALYTNGYFYILVGMIAQSGSTYNYYVESYSLVLTNLQQGFVANGVLATIITGASIAQQKGIFSGWDAQTLNNSIILAAQNSTSPTNTLYQIYPQGGGTNKSVNFAPPTSYGSFGNQYRIALSTAGPAANPIAVATPNYAYSFNADLSARGGGGSYTAPLSPLAVLWYGSDYYVFYEGTVATGTQISFLTGVAGTFGTIGTPCTSQQAGIASRPWIYNSKIYLWQFVSGYAGSGTFRAYVLTEYDPAKKTTAFIARTSYQDAWIANFGTMQNPCDVALIPGTNRYVTMFTQTTDAYGGIPATSTANPTYTSTYFGNLARTEFDFTPNARVQLYNMPTGGLFVAGAFPMQYDGQSLSEAGFTVSPEFITSPGAFTSSPQFSSTGGAIAAGTYYYTACFVRRDSYGNVLRSSPSIPYVITTTGSTGKVTFPALMYQGAANVYIEYYRTTIANPAQPYYVGKAALGQQFVDSFADSNINTNFTLYTYSGEYPNDPPPPVHSLAFGETRAYIIPSDARNQVWCSKKYSPGRSVEWTSNLILTEGGTHSGNFTAIAVLDTNVIVFKQDQILYFYGDGPDNAGATGSFSAFQRLSSDVGCIDPGSLAIIPGGLLFRSQRGIELLTRGLQVEYVGFPVEPLAQAITTIASAVVMPQYEQVRFVPSVPGEPVLVFDYLKNRWSTYSNMAALSAVNVLGNYWWISADGTTCNIETPNAFLDAGTTFITMTLETPEIPSAAIQGWGRVYRIGILGEMKSSHVLTTSFAYDHQEYYTNAVIYNAASSADQGTAVYFYDNAAANAVTYTLAPGPEQYRFSRVPRQVMQTLRLKLQDAPLIVYNASATAVTLPIGESCAISNITLEVGQKALLAKLPGSQTV